MGYTGHFMRLFSHLAGLNLVLTWDCGNNIINLQFHDNFPQNSFWLYDVMIALVKQPRDVCLVIILTPLHTEWAQKCYSSSPFSQRFSWTWKISRGWHGDLGVIFSQICHLIWSELCVGQISVSDWSSRLSYLGYSSDKWTFVTGDQSSLVKLRSDRDVGGCWSVFAVIWNIFLTSLSNICLGWRGLMMMAAF